MAISVRLQVFEGPLDLLLHLIEKNKVNIYDIPIAEITEQYLAYIRALKHEDMEIASEFMVMAAELLDIKCRMLLPKDPEEDEEEEDPREELVRRLLEYKMYKSLSGDLRDMMDAEDSVYRAPSVPKEVRSFRPKADPAELMKDLTLGKLRVIFEETLRRQKDKLDPIRSEFREVQTDPVRLDEKVRELAGYARKHRTFSFRKLMGRQKGRMQTIVMFLAVLEFMKAGYITIRQEEQFDDIEIEAVEGRDFTQVTIEGDSVDEYQGDAGGN